MRPLFGGLCAAIAAAMIAAAAPGLALADEDLYALPPLSERDAALAPFFEGMRDNVVANWIAQRCERFRIDDHARRVHKVEMQAIIDGADHSPDAFTNVSARIRTMFSNYWIARGFAPETIFEPEHRAPMCAHGLELSDSREGPGRFLRFVRNE